jgi:hypothetical protein
MKERRRMFCAIHTFGFLTERERAFLLSGSDSTTRLEILDVDAAYVCAKCAYFVYRGSRK